MEINIHTFTQKYKSYFDGTTQPVNISKNIINRSRETIAQYKYILNSGSSTSSNPSAPSATHSTSAEVKNASGILTFTKEKIASSGNLHSLALSENLQEIVKRINDPDDQLPLLKLNVKNYAKFSKIYESLSPHNKLQIMENLKKFINPCYHDFYNAFIPLDIQYDLENKKIFVICKFANFNCEECCKSGTYCVNVKVPIGKEIFFGQTKGPSVSTLRLSRIYNRITLFHKTRLHQFTFTAHIYLSQRKKVLDWSTKGIVIGPKEVNSAYCLSMPGSVKIVMYRSEEIDKLSLHELFHAVKVEGDYSSAEMRKFHNLFRKVSKYDHYCDSINNTQCTKKDKFNEEYITNISEGYVDFCADILNILLYSIEINKANGTSITSVFNSLLSLETNFSLFQVAKLLVYSGFNNYLDFYTKNAQTEIAKFIGSGNFTGGEAEGPGKIKQTTNVMSYFIIRGIILLNLGAITKVLDKFWKESGDLIDYFTLSPEAKMSALHKEIVASLLLPATASAIDSYIKQIKMGTYPIELLETMRRSIFELS